MLNLFISMVFYLLMTTMALYAIDRFAASDSAAGLTSSAFIIGSILGRVFAGKYLDIVGRRRLLMISLIAYAVASVLYLPVDNLAVLITLRVVHGIAFGAGNTAIAASAMALIPAHRRSEGTGYFSLSTSVATAAGPFLSAILLQEAGYDALFLVATASSVIAAVVALVLRLPEHAPSAADLAAKWRLRFGDVFDRAALPIASVALMTGACYSGVLIFFTSYARESGLGGIAGAFFLTYAGAVMLTRAFAGRLQDRRGDNAVMYPAILVFAAGLAVLGVADTAPAVLAAGAVIGIGFGALLPGAQAIAVTASGIDRVALATSTHFLALDIGIGIGPVLMGAAAPTLGYHGLFLLLAAVMLLGIVVYYFAHGRKGIGRAPRR